MSATKRLILAGAFGIFGVFIAVCISNTLHAFPLFSFAVNDLAWTRAWLYTTVLDYYGVAVPLCFIAVLSEDVPYGFMWALGFLLLGSPVACAYLTMRILFKTAVLADREREGPRSE
eukprot:gene34040-41200_t